MVAEHADAVVVGGGPAGIACAARLARLGRQAVVVERSAYREDRTGENLSAEARIVLRELGLDSALPDDALPSYAVRSAWGSHLLQDSPAVSNPYGHGWHLDRARFDRQLAEAAEQRGVVVYRSASVVELEPAECGAWRLVVGMGGERIPLGARFLVDASGRSAALGRRLGGTLERFDRLCGLAWRVDAEVEPWALIEAAEIGWWYSAPIPQGGAVVLLMTDADLVAAARNSTWPPHTYARLAGARERRGPRVLLAASQRLGVPPGARWLPAGDAAAALDPLSGQGLLWALRSGRDIAQAIDAFLGGEEAAPVAHVARVTGAFAEYMTQRSAYYAIEQRWPAAPFWARRHAPFPGGDRQSANLAIEIQAGDGASA